MSNIYLAVVLYSATGEGVYQAFAGGKFESPAAFVAYLGERVDGYYLQWASIHTIANAPKMLMARLKACVPQTYQRITTDTPPAIRFFFEEHFNY